MSDFVLFSDANGPIAENPQWHEVDQIHYLIFDSFSAI